MTTVYDPRESLVKIEGKEIMPDKSGDTVDQSPVNRGITVSYFIGNCRTQGNIIHILKLREYSIILQVLHGLAQLARIVGLLACNLYTNCTSFAERTQNTRLS